MALPKRILIAHGDPEARNAVRSLAESRVGRVVKLEASSFDTMIEKLREEPGTELVIVDFDLPGMFWEVGLRHLLAIQNGMRIAVLFSTPDREKLRSLGAKLVTLVPKQLPREALAKVLGQVIEGKEYVPTANDLSLAADSSARPAPPAARAEESPAQAIEHSLTGRQIDVLRLLSEGYSNHEIGEALSIAEGTVKVHVNAAFRILGVHNRVSAASAFRQYVEDRLSHAGGAHDHQ